MTQQEILELFKKTDALLEGHFLLTSGKHSNQYFQCAKVLQYPKYTEQICKELVEFFKDHEIDTVISPAIGGIVVGQEVARQLDKKFIFAERKEKDMQLRRGFEIKEGEKVLVCEDVVTTGGSVFEVIEIVKQNGGEVAGVGMIVDRSNGKVDFGVPQKSTLQIEVIAFEPEEVPEWLAAVPVQKPGSRKSK